VLRRCNEQCTNGNKEEERRRKEERDDGEMMQLVRLGKKGKGKKVVR